MFSVLAFIRDRSNFYKMMWQNDQEVKEYIELQKQVAKRDLGDQLVLCPYLYDYRYTDLWEQNHGSYTSTDILESRLVRFPPSPAC